MPSGGAADDDGHGAVRRSGNGGWPAPLSVRVRLREPDGVLSEIVTHGPGFAADEPVAPALPANRRPRPSPPGG